MTEETTLVFSFVGMATQKIVVGSNTTVNVSMETDAIGLEEVVAIGYGTSKKSDLTGAVIRADLGSAETMPNISIAQALQGSVPGLNVGATNRAGASPSITIRGRNTFSGTTAPLIVLDGVIYNGNMADLNPADIESIDILKDASSKAIYGSQAANGVMLITSKSGKTGKTQFKYSTYYSVQTPANILTPHNADEHIQKQKDAHYLSAYTEESGYTIEDPNFDIESKWTDVNTREGYALGTDVDWLDLTTQKGNIQNHNLSMSGKTGSTAYYISGSYTGQKGYIIGDEYQKLTLRANFDNEVNSWLKVGMQTFITSADYSGVTPDMRISYLMPALNTPYDENGELLEYPHTSMRNPLFNSKVDDLDKRMNLYGNFYAEVKLPFVEGLKFKTNYSSNYRTSRNYRFDSYAQNNTGSGYKNNGVGQDFTFDNMLTYNRVFAENHTVGVTALYGHQKRWGDGTNASAAIFLNDDLGYNSLESGAVEKRGVSSSAYDEYAIYQLARLFYGYKSKYLFTGTVRRDGFSGFGSNKKFGIFPSGAFAWVVSKEEFVANTLPMLSNLKLRASYGKSGNRTIGRYGTLAKVGTGYTGVFGNESAYGQWISSLANDDLGWESTTGINLGLDFGIYNNRVTGFVEYYNDKTEDVLFAVNLPRLTGFNSILSNIGEIHNNGIETSVTGVIISKNDFNWSTTINFSQNNDEIVSILGLQNDADEDGKEDDLIANNLFIGEPRGVIYHYTIDGIYQLGDEIPNGYKTGNYIVRDLNEGDEDYDGYEIKSTDDRSIIGYTAPAYRWSMLNEVNYKNWNLRVFINSIQGGKNGYYGNITPSSNGAWSGGSLLTSNIVKEWDYWSPNNPDAEFQGLSSRGAVSPNKYQQRSFVRLQELSLGYKVNSSFVSKIGIRGLDFHISGKNLLTITDWIGTDPELGLGLNAGHMPLQKSFSAGVNVSF